MSEAVAPCGLRRHNPTSPPKSPGYETERVQEIALSNLDQAREFYWAQQAENIRKVMEECRGEPSTRGYPWYEHAVGILEAGGEELLAREMQPGREFRAAMEELYPGFSESHDTVEEIDLALGAVDTMAASDFDAIDNLHVRRDEEEDVALGIDDETRAGFHRLRDLDRRQGRTGIPNPRSEN